MRKYLKRFQSYWKDTMCILKFVKGHNYKKTIESYVTFICPSSDDTLHLYQVSRKYLKGFQSYWVDMYWKPDPYIVPCLRQAQQ